MTKKRVTESPVADTGAGEVQSEDHGVVQPPTTASWKFEDIHVSVIEPSPYQTRRRFDGIDELAANIKAHGMIHPITVRMTEPGSYELIAGERRLRASRVAFGYGSSIYARVLEISDAEAAELCVTENMQRSDLTPIEEAEGVKALLDTGHTVEDASERLCRSVQWVRRRANLIKLCKKVRDAIENPEHNMSIAPVAGLELIAALPDDLQVKVCDQFKWHAPKIDDIRKFVERMMHELKNAPFSTSECIKCMRRTGIQPDLFDGAETSELGRCLDDECWKKKRDAALKAMVEDIRKDAPKAIIVSDDWNIRQVVPGIKCVDEVTKCKKSDEGAIPAYNIDSNGNAKKLWIRKPSSASSPYTSEPRRPTEEHKEMAKYLKGLAARIEESLSKEGINPFKNICYAKVLHIVSVTGTISETSWANPSQWPKESEVAEKDMEDILDELWKDVSAVLLRRIRFDTIVGCVTHYADGVAIAQHVFGDDISTIPVPVPDPKSNE